MSSHRDVEPEDLSALSRQGLLSDAEAEELERHLASDPELRLLHTVGLDFDRSGAVRPGDDALVARSAEAALSRVRASGLARVSDGTRSRRRFRVAALLAVAAVFATGMAAAVWTGVVAPAAWFDDETEEAAPVQATEVKGRAPTAKRKSVTPAVSADPLPATAPASDSTVVRAAPRASAARSAEETAAALFSAGNAARRDGDFGRAQRSYSDLIARYPGSDEARLARVSLGKLLLAQGETSDAERAFDDYLKDGKGQLAEEALVSRAESLRKMGRTDDERRTWQRLLADHPDSVYAAEAKARLAALGRTGAPPVLPQRAHPTPQR